MQPLMRSLLGHVIRRLSGDQWFLWADERDSYRIAVDKESGTSFPYGAPASQNNSRDEIVIVGWEGSKDVDNPR